MEARRLGTKEGANSSHPPLRHRQAPSEAGTNEPRPGWARSLGLLRRAEKLAVFSGAPPPSDGRHANWICRNRNTFSMMSVQAEDSTEFYQSFTNSARLKWKHFYQLLDRQTCFSLFCARPSLAEQTSNLNAPKICPTTTASPKPSRLPP
jgi:hypothetical protein